MSNFVFLCKLMVEQLRKLPALTQLQKIKLTLSFAWSFMGTFYALGQDSIALLIFINLPPLLYWFGWIVWGETVVLHRYVTLIKNWIIFLDGQYTDPDKPKIEGRTNNYFGNHWFGKFPLSVSFWINGVLLTLCLPWIIGSISYTLGRIDVASASIVNFFITIMFLWVATMWQIVGIWRAAEKYLAQKSVQKKKKLSYFYARFAQLFASSQMVLLIYTTVSFLVNIYKLPVT